MSAPRTPLPDLPVEEIENLFIPMPDGTRLAARIWLPRDARARPVPAILELIPYRKRDFMRARDEPMHGTFAANGFASVRVDVRGTGDSGGILEDEYTAQERDDACEVIAWIAQQSWCSGAVGMMGISWGGFNALQVAAKNPPHLKAIISVCASDDRYADDAHYMGGCLLNENMQWGSILMLYATLPPDPDVVGERWRDMWRQRLEAVRAHPAEWMRHQTRDAYWRDGSVCEDLSLIRVPVYIVGGWADGYTNAVFRLLSKLTVPRKGIIGPWGHQYPHIGVPGPAVDFLSEAISWWRHWLADEETGVMDGPMLRVWMQDSVAPQPHYAERPGRWVAEPAWPPEHGETHTLALNIGHLSSDADPCEKLSFTSPQTVGVRAGEWCGFGADGEMPRDQRPDDGGSLIFDTSPLAEPLELLGAPILRLTLSIDRPAGLVCARLMDVAPDGSSLRVSYALLNLTHRHGHDRVEACTPGEEMVAVMRLNMMAHAFPMGHRIRLALSTSYWPIAWPSPQAVTATVMTGVSTLTLPVRRSSPIDRTLAPLGPPPPEDPSTFERRRPLPQTRVLAVDLSNEKMTYTLKGDGGEFGGASLAYLPAIDLELGYTLERTHTIVEGDPSSATMEMMQTARLSRRDWLVTMACRTALTATRETFLFTATVVARHNEEPISDRAFSISIPRHHV